MSEMHLVRCGAIAGFEALLYRQEVDPVALLAEHNITMSHLRDPDNYISYLKLAQLLELASERSQDPYFGLRLAATQSQDIFGELGLALAIQTNYDEAMEYLKEHLHIHAQGANLNPRNVGKFTRLEFSVDFSDQHEMPQLKQMSIGQMAKSMLQLAQIDPGFSMHLQQADTGDQTNQVSFFPNDKLRFDSDFDGIQFTTSWQVQNQIFEIDPKPLREYIYQRIESLEQNRPQRLEEKLRLLLTRTLATGDYSVKRMAAALDLHPRSLQLRLKEEGTSYSQVLQKTREDISCRKLQQSNIGITDLALQLGYAEVAIFSRHFKQWTGYSPRAWRKQHQARSETLLN